MSIGAKESNRQNTPDGLTTLHFSRTGGAYFVRNACVYEATPRSSEQTLVLFYFKLKQFLLVHTRRRVQQQGRFKCGGPQGSTQLERSLVVFFFFFFSFTWSGTLAFYFLMATRLRPEGNRRPSLSQLASNVIPVQSSSFFFRHRLVYEKY